MPFRSRFIKSCLQRKVSRISLYQGGKKFGAASLETIVGKIKKLELQMNSQLQTTIDNIELPIFL